MRHDACFTCLWYYTHYIFLVGSGCCVWSSHFLEKPDISCHHIIEVFNYYTTPWHMLSSLFFSPPSQPFFPLSAHHFLPSFSQYPTYIPSISFTFMPFVTSIYTSLHHTHIHHAFMFVTPFLWSFPTTLHLPSPALTFSIRFVTYPPHNWHISYPFILFSHFHSSVDTFFTLLFYTYPTIIFPPPLPFSNIVGP